MIDREFELQGKKFKLCKLDAMKQFHTMRRLTPILSSIIPVLEKMKGKKLEDEQGLEALAPILDGISKLSDEDANKVLFSLLSTVEIQQAQGNWAKVVANDSLMFHDMDLPLLMQLAARSFGYNFQSFLAVNPQASIARG